MTSVASRRSRSARIEGERRAPSSTNGPSDTSGRTCGGGGSDASSATTAAAAKDMRSWRRSDIYVWVEIRPDNDVGSRPTCPDRAAGRPRQKCWTFTRCRQECRMEPMPTRARPAPPGADAPAREVRRLSSLLEVSQALSGTLNLKASLHRVLEILARHHGALRSIVSIL